MDKKNIVYRGSLKSCNYLCSYCPFSKRKMTQKELDADKRQWLRFTESLAQRAASLQIGALLVAPYGEALLHPWYWDGLAALSALPYMEAVGAQTNLSFPADAALEHFRRAEGNICKLRLWATFHPEMVSVRTFAEKCISLHRAGIAVCAGAVAAPKHLPLLQKLRALLPREIYLWINRMDNRRAPYTKNEIDAFLEVDSYFVREMAWPRSDPGKCTGRLFVESNGRLRACCIAPASLGNWYGQFNADAAPKCSRKTCSCYLAYGGQDDYMNRILFGDFPLFRIPRRPKAVFFDIQGTLLPDGSSKIPRRTELSLTALTRENIPLFFATTLPYEDAARRCAKIWHLFDGGIFAGGAHLLLENSLKKKEEFLTFSVEILPWLHSMQKEWQFRILIYRDKKARSKESVYKITLLRPRQRPWLPHETDALWTALPARLRQPLRQFTEGRCLQIVSKDSDKGSGVRTFCKWLKISPSEAAAAGDGTEDIPMLNLLADRPPELLQ